MTAHCCAQRGGLPPLARRLSEAAASMLPGLGLVLLPKCPLCLAAWLTIATGVAVSAAVAAWIHGLIVAFGVAVVAFVAVQMIRRRERARETGGRTSACAAAGGWVSADLENLRGESFRSV
jgi:threonine/homoserine/homoserine lactone efflux protein